jgi:hypothetical protein
MTKYGLGLFLTAAHEVRVCIRNEKMWIDFGQSLNTMATIMMWFSGALTGALSGKSLIFFLLYTQKRPKYSKKTGVTAPTGRELVFGLIFFK